ncbi:MAG: hypothetical protein IPH84_13910 [Bacteroidales bacterium]|nr:hypothetical protein [Bacteroidales bacterium]
MSKSAVVRPSVLTIGARYDSRSIGFGITTTAYDYQRIHVGVNARIFGFFIGSEKITSFFKLADFTGIDFYGGIKFNLQKGKCRSFTSSSCGNNEYKLYQKKSGNFFKRSR